ncbi:MAG: universal stress protein [Devosia sp.]
MFTKLLIATDGSALGSKALQAGLELARLHGASVIVMTASDPIDAIIGTDGIGGINAGPIVAQLEERYAAEAASILEAARKEAVQAGVAVETLHVPLHRPADAIVQTVLEKACDTIVMGSHGRRGIGRLLLGSQAAEVLARAAVPVLVVK